MYRRIHFRHRLDTIPRLFRKALRGLSVLPFLLLGLPLDAAPLDAETLFNRNVGALYQVRVINKSTREKSSIGSGFIVGRKDLLATNFHVVSDFIHKPETYSLEYLSSSGEHGALTVLDVDVPHDLAILRAEKNLGQPMKTGAVPEKGAPLYAMGNPHDLGMSLTDGTNNGVLPQSNDGRIHFSGSLNPGMSGGPTMDSNGDVIGVNVATAGNNISFIIPARYLDSILKDIVARDFEPVDDLLNHINQQLQANQKQYLQHLAGGDWPETTIGRFKVPGEISHTVRCWDASKPPKPTDLFNRLFTHCQNQNEIFLYDNLEVGKVKFEYIWLDSDDLGPTAFYNLYQQRFVSRYSNHGSKQDVTNFKCQVRFLQIDEKQWKVNLCRRDYLRYPELSDMVLTAAMIGESDQGMIFNLYLTGTDFDSALILSKRFLESFTWQH
jgi:S1-C subfamily serine protease